MASVLITGTSKGIGFEAALAFGRAGHKVHAPLLKWRSQMTDEQSVDLNFSDDETWYRSMGARVRSQELAGAFCGVENLKARLAVKLG